MPLIHAATSTAEDKAKTLQNMREVLREVADLRIRAANSVGEQVLYTLRLRAEAALARDELDNADPDNSPNPAFFSVPRKELGGKSIHEAMAENT